MPDYSVTFARSARKELERLPSSVGSRIFGRIEALTKAPRPRGVIKLHGSKNLWRMRVGEAYPGVGVKQIALEEYGRTSSRSAFGPRL
jgi:hypothetical protein